MKQEMRPGRFQMLYRFADGVRRYFVLAAFAAVLSIVFNFLMPQVIMITVDSVIGSEPFRLPTLLTEWIESAGGREMLRSHLVFCALACVLFSVLSGLSNFLCRVGIAKTAECTVRKMRDTLYDHVQHLPFSWHVKNQTGDVIQRCTSDVEVVRNFISGQLIEVLRTVILVIMALWLMFSMNFKLSMIALVFVPVILFYSGFFYSKIARRFHEADDAEGRLTATVQENLTGVRVVRAFGREAYEMDRFDEKNNGFANLWIRLGYLLSYYWTVGDLVSGLQLMIILVLGAVEAANGQITLGEFMVFVSYNSMLIWPLRGLGRILSEMSKTGVSLHRIKEILDEPVEADAPDAVMPPMDGDIVFDNVSFRYDNGKDVVEKVSFTIPAGSTFAILGGTGSGKSTLMHLLNRLYDLPSGQGKITVGGVDLQKIKRDWVRSQVGMVLQEPFLFSKTIQENIKAAAPMAELEEIRHFAAIAAVDDAILGFSEGYDTIVGERGVTLSGGQKQRVAIARMLMQKTPIMIFDDSLSAVDTETDAQIRRALKNTTQKTTTILISHRVTTLMGADQILVLDGGRVSDIGTHEELIRRDGIYRRIYEIQEKIEDEVEADSQAESLTIGGEA